MFNQEDQSIRDKYKEYLQKGYMEVFLSMNTGQTWKVRELNSIAEKAECHNTGWPIGVTLTRADLAPYPVEDGLETVIPSEHANMFDYWSLKKNGDFYFIRTLQEDEKPTLTKSGKNVFWLDIQLFRIAEALLYCSNLGRELKVDFSNKIDIYISYNGLKGRVLSCNSPDRFWIHDEMHTCKADKFEFQLNESLDYLKLNYRDIIFDIGNDLGFYFGRFVLDKSVSDGIVDKFLKSKV